MDFNDYASLRNTLILPELYNTIISNNQTAAVWDLLTLDQKSVSVPRLTSYPNVNAVTCSTSISAGSYDQELVEFDFSTFETNVPVCWDTLAGANDDNFANRSITMALLGAVSEKMEALIVNGGGNLEGITDLVTATNTFDATTSGDISHLSKAIRLQKHSGGSRVFVANGDTYDAIEEALRTELHSLQYSELLDGTFNVLGYRGIPVVINDNLAADDVYLVGLGGDGVSVVLQDTGGTKIGGVFETVTIPQSATSINEYRRVLFRATQIVRNPQSIVRIENFI